MNKSLIEAVEVLRRKGVIRKDKEVADKTGYDKSTVSNYLNGKMKASDAFIKKFEEVFKIKEDENMIVDIPADNGNSNKDNQHENFNVKLKHDRLAKVVLPLNAKKEDVQVVIEYLKLMLKSME